MGGVGEVYGELGGGQLEGVCGLFQVSVGVLQAVRVGELVGHEGRSGEAAGVVVGVGTGQFAGEHFVRVRAHVDDEREQRVAGGEPFEVV